MMVVVFADLKTVQVGGINEKWMKQVGNSAEDDRGVKAYVRQLAYDMHRQVRKL